MPKKSLSELQALVEQGVGSIVYDYPAPALFEPIRYILSLGGKRIRPTLLLMAHNLYADCVEGALDVALAIETFHNFTLLHDDLMDKSAMRRGNPTAHVKWNDNTAILSGDAMQILAYDLLLRSESPALPQLLPLFTRTAMEVCAGQQMDMEFESRLDVTVDEYLEMIRLKTAVLLGGALKMGALTGGATPGDADALYDFGVNVGMAFQLKDDLLDLFGDQDQFGKPIGGDILNNKKTFLLISALANASEQQRGEMIDYLALSPSTPEAREAKIELFRNAFIALGIKELSEVKMQEYYEKAIAALASLSVDGDATQGLRAIADNLMTRES